MTGAKLTWGEFLNDQPLRTYLNRLKDWKQDGSVTVWLHTNTGIWKRLFHLVPYVKEKSNEKTGEVVEEIEFFAFICHEDINEYGKTNPRRCPICRFRSYLENTKSIKDKEMVWSSSVGDFKRDRRCKKEEFVGAGGDWRLSFIPQFQYVMALINHNNIEEGIVVSEEKRSIGIGIQNAVKNAVKSKGEEGDPTINPQAFMFEYDRNAKNKSDYYNVVYPYERVDLTDEIQTLLDKDAIDMSNYILPGDTNKLREIMDAHVTVDVDLDEFFDNVCEEQSVYGEFTNIGYMDDELENPKRGRSNVKENKPIEPAKKQNKSSSQKRGRSNVKENKPIEPAKKQNKSSSQNKQPPKQLIKEPETVEEGPFSECPACKGSGVIGKAKKICHICKGSGEVDMREEAVEEKPKKKTRVVKQEEPEPVQEETVEEDNTCPCPGCNRTIHEDALTCIHCGVEFED